MNSGQHDREMPSPGSDAKPLGLISASAIVAASMIGAGVYTTSGFTLGSLQDPFWVVVAWCVAGLVAVCGAVCYAALASEFTESGGEYLFLSRVLHPVTGVMAGWVSLLAGFSGALALAATTFAQYAAFWQATGADTQWQGNAIAIGLVLVAAAQHSFGVKLGAIVQDISVGLKVLLIVAFIIIAILVQWPRDAVAESAAIADTPLPTGFAFITIFATQLMWISLSYSGFNAAVYVAGEVNRPKRNVPRAMVLGTLLVTVIYVALNAIFVYAPPSETIKMNPQVATAAAKAIGGDWFALFIRTIILIGLFTSVSALTMTGPRVYAKMAEEGFLPRVFRFQGDVPVVAIWIQACLAITVICVSDLKTLLGYLGFTLAVSAALTASLVFRLHFKKESSVRVPLFPIPPIIFVCGTLLTAVLTAIDTPAHAIAGLITIGCGLLYYPWYRMRQPKKYAADAGTNDGS